MSKSSKVGWVKPINQFVVVVVMVLVSSVGFAKEKGETGAAFLKIGAGARATALGEAYVGLADDVSACYWNPAGLTQLQEKQASFMYLSPMGEVDDLSYSHLGLSVPHSDKGVFGASISYYGYGEMDKVVDSSGTPQGTWKAYDLSLVCSWAKQVKANLACGTSLKMVAGKIDDSTARSFAVDLAALFQTNYPGLSLGAVITNLGTKMKYRNEGAPLPMALKLGAAYRCEQAPVILVCDATLPNDNDAYFSLGGEYTIKEMFALRAGYKSGPQDEGSGLTAGFGLKYLNYGLDYAYQPYDDLGDSHYVSLKARF